MKDRIEDIPLLVDKFLGDIAAEYGSAKKEITDKAIKELQKLPWTGNIRELRNVTERLIIMCGAKIDGPDVKRYTDIK